MSNNNKIPKSYYHKSNETLSLGCGSCPERDTCGGIQSSGAIISCLDFCECDNSQNCDIVCFNNPTEYTFRFQEVRGFLLDNVPRVKPIINPAFPPIVPLIYNGSSRERALKIDTVVIPLRKLYKHESGVPRYASKLDLCNDFRISPDTRIIISGVDKDYFIESYWSHRKVSDLVGNLVKLSPDLVTSPNYSLPLKVPRTDNLYNIKRIAIAWSEIASVGIPTSLHVNARTDVDWERWSEFISGREEITSLSFEFGTGGKKTVRGKWYVEKLLNLASSINRPFQLIIRGGSDYISQLRQGFNEVVYVDTTSFVKTVKRKKLYWSPNLNGGWKDANIDKSIMLDDLLESNIANFTKKLSFEKIMTLKLLNNGHKNLGLLT